MNTTINALIYFGMIIGIMLVGMDFVTKAAGFQTLYRRTLNMAWQYVKRHVTRFVRWAWREHKKFIIGFAGGVFITLYCMGVSREAAFFVK